MDCELSGHAVTVEANEGKGGWRWRYCIDGTWVHQAGDLPLKTEELAISEGLSEAKQRLGNPMHPGK